MDHLNENNLLTEKQHGFRPQKSINTAVIQFCDFITKNWEENNNVIGIYLDIEKAFDSLNWKILINKLNALNIKQDAQKWIKSYLTNRKQQVEIGYIKNNIELKTKSKLQDMTQGIPQGSILGPLLFIIYEQFSENLPKGMDCIIFADDTTVLILEIITI